ncbi:MAG: hypothetical protein ABUS47_04845 [Steroidobacter sp.]
MMANAISRVNHTAAIMMAITMATVMKTMVVTAALIAISTTKTARNMSGTQIDNRGEPVSPMDLIAAASLLLISTWVYPCVTNSFRLRCC